MIDVCIRETEEALGAEAAAICAREGGPPRSWQDLLAEIRADHPAADELIPTYQQAIEIQGHR